MKLNQKGIERTQALQKIHDEALRDMEAMFSVGVDPSVLKGNPSPGSREMALARTNLEQAFLWAVKAVSLQAGNQE